ncbi:patatin-like phospholipase family protein [soil metagenome]
MKKTVALVLTSGSARGLAHIGAIEEILERGYEIKVISGSSMGAVVGGLLAADKLELYRDWMITLSRMDVFNLFDFSFSSAGLLKGERVFEEMARLLGDAQIEDCTIPYTAVVTDLITKKELWLRKGSLFKAIRASVAIPTIVTPVYTDTQILVDGGVLNPMPIEPVLEYDYDLLIVVNTHADIPYKKSYEPSKQEKKDAEVYEGRLAQFRKKYSKYLTLYSSTPNTDILPRIERLGSMSLLSKAVDLMENRIIELSLEKHHPDIVIPVSREVCTMFEFYKAKETIEAGRAAAKETLDNFEAQLAKREL